MRLVSHELTICENLPSVMPPGLLPMMIVVLQFLGWEDDPMRVKYIARIWALCDHRLALNPSVLIFSMATVWRPAWCVSPLQCSKPSALFNQ